MCHVVYSFSWRKPKELESYFIVTIEKKGKNTIIGAIIYRHPCMNKEMFTGDLMEPLTEKLTNENQHIPSIAGDYNFDLLSTND